MRCSNINISIRSHSQTVMHLERKSNYSLINLLTLITHCLTVSSLSSTRLPGLLLDFGARSILQTLLPVFTDCEHRSALSSSWRLSSAELFMAPHLSTYRISCSTLLTFRRDAVVASAHRHSNQSSRRPPVAMCYCRRSVVWYCRPSTLEQYTCWRPVCLITHNILSKAENSFISAILPRHCFVTACR